MITINLLPKKQKKARHIFTSENIKYVAIFSTFLLVYVVSFAVLRFNIMVKQDYLNQINMEISSYKKVQDLLTKNRALALNVQNIEKNVASALQKEATPDVLIKDLASIIPKSCRIDELTFTNEGKKVLIKASATTFLDLTRFYINISISEKFKDISLVEYTIPFKAKAKDGKIPRVTFNISVTWLEEGGKK